MDEMTSKVYIKTDADGRITRCEGGYTMPADLTGWTEIDEGIGDRFNLCQSHYFGGGLYTQDAICRYKYADGVCALRTDAEIEADRAAIATAPSADEDRDALAVDHEYRLTLLEIGLSAAE
jgi:hypothetical protein